MKYFKRNGFVALVSMLSLTAYAGDSLPLSVAVSETKEFIQVSGHGIDTSNVIQQERIIQGTVLEEGTNEPLVGVNVVVKGTTIGTTTDIDGKYSIKIPSDKAILVFSYIGQKTEEYSVKGLNFLNVIMKSDATMLSEVVVYTGYMTQKKADLTGSVAMANASDLKKNASANAMKSLQGKMAGVHITTNGGNPAEGTTVQIRGLSSLSGGVKPLIVLDGMPTENLNLRDINSGDIESIQVLKDAASASIYGARASGGVILIQTKKGQAGKTNIEYNGSVSINTVLNKPTLMNAEQYGRAAFQAQAYDERVYGTSISLPSAYNYTWHRGDNGIAVLDEVKVAEYLNADQTVRGSDTDWMGEIFQTAISHNHQLTISNGSEKSKSLFSLGYFNNEGTQIHTFFRQYSIRANTEYSLIKNHLKVGENLAVSYLQYRDQSNGDWTSIPTAAIRANGIDYVHYFNMRNWTGWITNYSGIYKSVDNGLTWAKCKDITFSSYSFFGQVGYFKKDGYVYMIGTQTGRDSNAKLARFHETDIENKTAYEYWNAFTNQWIKGNENEATVLIEDKVGELSFIYNETHKKWIIAYFNADRYNITMRTAEDITGPWSEPYELANGREYAQLYGSYIHPLSVTGDNLYFTMSMWMPYNVFLMKAELADMGEF